MAKGKYQEWLTEDGLLLLRRWARQDLTDKKIADKMGVAAGTLYRWKNEHREICEALKRTREICISEMEESLEKSGHGYYVVEEEWANKWNPHEKKFELLLVKKTRKWIKPDTTAQIFYLKNRDRTNWRDKQEIQLDADEKETGVIALPDTLAPEQPPEEVGKNG